MYFIKFIFANNREIFLPAINLNSRIRKTIALRASLCYHAMICHEFSLLAEVINFHKRRLLQIIRVATNNLMHRKHTEVNYTSNVAGEN